MAITNSAVTNLEAANIYASTGETTVVTMYIANYTASSVSANLYLVQAAGTASTANQILTNLTIGAYDTYVMNTERLTLANGEMIQANANAATSLTATVSYTSV